MESNISRKYRRVLSNLNLDDYPMSDYNEFDMFSFIWDMERAFNIHIDKEKANKLFENGSHEDWIEYIRTLL